MIAALLPVSRCSCCKSVAGGVGEIWVRYRFARAVYLRSQRRLCRSWSKPDTDCLDLVQAACKHAAQRPLGAISATDRPRGRPDATAVA